MPNIARRIVPLEISCSYLPLFAQTDLESIRGAFKAATVCHLRQAWLDHEEERFAPATVRVGRRKDSLMIFAELTDTDAFNSATERNQRVWELGDVFEIFLRAEWLQRYVEFQVAPNNQRLQLCYPDAESVELARRTGELKQFLIRGDAFKSQTWMSRGAWNIYAEIPVASVCGRNESLEKSRWRFSFGRYDYTRGAKEAVISSTSPHARPDFHRQQEWGMMTFAGGSQTGPA